MSATTMLIAVTAMGVAATDSGAQPRRMNVAMIIADDLRNQIGQSRVPGTPQMHTPAIDSLADRGVLFAQTRTSLIMSPLPTPPPRAMLVLHCFFTTVIEPNWSQLFPPHA